MRGFFDMDSPFMRGLSRMADLMIVNLLVLFTCIPVITVGASLTAMHYVLIKMSRNEETYIIKMYFKSFKENFVQATAEWIIMLLVLGVFVYDFFMFFRTDAQFSSAIVLGVFFVAIIFTMTSMYIFPLQARFVNKIGGTIKNAFLIMILNFPKSILMLIVYAAPVVLLLVSDFAVPFLIMFGVSVPAFGAVYLYRKVFSKFEPEEESITSDMDFTVAVDSEESEQAEVVDNIATIEDNSIEQGSEKETE